MGHLVESTLLEHFHEVQFFKVQEHFLEQLPRNVASFMKIMLKQFRAEPSNHRNVYGTFKYLLLCIVS